MPFYRDTFLAACWIKSSLRESGFKSLSGTEPFLKLRHFAASFVAFFVSKSFSFSHFCSFSVNYRIVSSNFVIYCDFKVLVLFKAYYFALLVLITDDLSSFNTEIYVSVCFLNSSWLFKAILISYLSAFSLISYLLTLSTRISTRYLCLS